MNVLEIVKLACIYLQLEEILELTEFGGVVTDADDLTAKNLELLTRCLNLVYDEIATDYIPLNFTEEVEVISGVVELSSLSKRLINVIKLSDSNGKTMRYKMYPTTIEVANGSYQIEYSYMPSSVELSGELEQFSGKLTERIVAYGLASEYCLISGLFDEATLWEKRFKDALLIASRKKSDTVMPSRRWF